MQDRAEPENREAPPVTLDAQSIIGGLYVEVAMLREQVRLLLAERDELTALVNEGGR